MLLFISNFNLFVCLSLASHFQSSHPLSVLCAVLFAELLDVWRLCP